MKARLAKAKDEYGVYFIAELGQNHQGDINIAKRMVDSLTGIGVSAIKTAKRDIDTCLTEDQKSMIYDNPNSFGRTYYEHRKALELSHDDFRELKRYSEANGFDFISSFTDHNSLDFLCEIGVTSLKIASQRVTDLPLLTKAANTKLPVILSTGMSTLNEIYEAIDIFSDNELYLLQCTSCYPCADEDLNLNVLQYYIDNIFADGYGFSGHHTGIAPDLAAYVMGAEIIERHYTLHRHWKGTDHAASLELKGIENIMKYIGQIKKSFGTSKKYILDCEMVALKKLRNQ
jgi:sialic acid synthase